MRLRVHLGREMDVGLPIKDTPSQLPQKNPVLTNHRNTMPRVKLRKSWKVNTDDEQIIKSQPIACKLKLDRFDYSPIRKTKDAFFFFVLLSYSLLRLCFVFN